ncbi:MAG: MFS transporter [Alphaproteobacteria bacterium]|nr:MFS transporter [Alphaproteobacteria bacterium]
MPVLTSSRTFLLAAVLLAAFNLRTVLGSLPPLLETVRAELALGFSAIGILGAIPIACMAVFPPLAVRPAARFGPERVLFTAVIATAIAALLRWGSDHVALLYGSTVAAGISVAVTHAMLAPTVKRAFAADAAGVMGLVATMMTVSAGIAAGGTAYLADAFGSWTLALAVWAIPALVGVALWLPIARAAVPVALERTAYRIPWRSGIAWRITTVAAAAGTLFWSIFTWMPPIYQDAGWSKTAAGLITATMVIAQAPTTFAVAALAKRIPDRRWLIAAGLALCVTGAAGFAFTPYDGAWVWAIVTGAGIGFIFPLAQMLPIDFGRDPPETAGLAAMALSVGYACAALGPLAIGWLREVTGSYVAPLVLMMAIAGAAFYAIGGLKPRAPDASR